MFCQALKQSMLIKVIETKDFVLCGNHVTVFVKHRDQQKNVKCLLPLETESHSELMMGKELQQSPRSSDGNRNAQHVSSAKQSRVSSLSLNYVDHIVKKNQPHELLKILPSQEIDAMPNSISRDR